MQQSKYNPDQKPIPMTILEKHPAVIRMREAGFDVDAFRVSRKSAQMTVQPVTMAVRLKFTEKSLLDIGKVLDGLTKLGDIFDKELEVVLEGGVKRHFKVGN